MFEFGGCGYGAALLERRGDTRDRGRAQPARGLQKFPLIKSEDSQTLLRTARNRSLLLTDVPSAFALSRDPDDEPYTDLAIAATANYLVTWNDRHLTYLMRQDTSEGIEFCRRFPHLKIVDPPTFLREIRELTGADKAP